MRAEPGTDHRALPSRRARRRRPRAVPRRCRGEAAPARARGGSVTARTANASLARRVDALEWPVIVADLDATGAAHAGVLLTDDECTRVRALYDNADRFRTTVDMARHRFGAGEYKYFDRPLPEVVERLRAAFWPHLLPVAREWAARLGRPAPWPDELDAWLTRCHLAGQTRPTPLLLDYGPGDWHALHRDLYGDLVFPLQVVVALDEPDVDYTGGEFLLVEQRPRAQSRGTAMTLSRGSALVFTTRDRPVASARGWSAAPMRHGVSVLRRGHRLTLGLIFHDAK